MKYTRYILSDRPIDFGGFGIAAIPAAVFAIPLLTWLLGGAVLMDGGRIVKLRYLLFKREQRRLNYIKCVLISLDRVPNNQLIGLLTAA